MLFMYFLYSDAKVRDVQSYISILPQISFQYDAWLGMGVTVLLLLVMSKYQLCCTSFETIQLSTVTLQ